VSSRVVVRIRRRGNRWLVIGRKTSQECATFEEAWAVSVEYWALRRW